MQKTIKSFVLRAGRSSPRQQHAYETWLADYVLPEPPNPWSLKTVFGRDADTVVEIGFGMGASLLAMAKARPELNFVGIEVHRAGVGSLTASLHEEAITNVRIAPYGAVEVFKTCLGDNVLLGIQVFFPDPWPKKRHHKRRLIQQPFVKSMVSKIKPGGFIHCATDWEAYAEEMRTVLSEEPLLQNQQPDGGYAPRPASRPLTKFELRGHQLGHGVWDLIFQKVGSGLA